MACANCEFEGTAYTLSVHVTETGATVDLPFCSSDCLDDWI